jgi:uncharacterized protein with HEPN domain
MQRDLAAYLWDITDGIEQIESFVAGSTLEQYLANRLVQADVERKLSKSSEKRSNNLANTSRTV